MLLDIGTGILSAFFLSKALSINLTWGFILAGVIFNLLPDLEALIKNKKLKKAYTNPIIYLLFGTIIISFIALWSFALLFAVTGIIHLIREITDKKYSFSHKNKRWFKEFKVHPYVVFEFLVFVLGLFILLQNPPV